MSYVGDFATGVTFDVKFTTVNTTGTPTNMAGSPAISIYKNNSVTQFTTGVTLTTNFDSVAGLNNLRVACTNATNFTTGAEYQAVITSGTVAGVSVVGSVSAMFSLNNRAALRPATAGRTLVVNSTGIADANVKQWLGGTIPAVNVTGVPKVDVVDWLGAAVSGLVDPPANWTLLSIDGSGQVAVGSMAAGAVTATAINTGAITAAKFAAGAITSTVINTNAIGASELASDVITDIWQGTALTEAYATDGAAATPAQLLYMIWSALAEFAIASTTITAKKLDGSTTAMTFTLDDASNPTSRTRAS